MSKANQFIEEYNKLSTPNQDAHEVALQQLAEALGEIQSSDIDVNDPDMIQEHLFDDGSRARTRLGDDTSDDGDDPDQEFIAELLTDADDEDTDTDTDPESDAA
jgi:hypothetical protein